MATSPSKATTYRRTDNREEADIGDHSDQWHPPEFERWQNDPEDVSLGGLENHTAHSRAESSAVTISLLDKERETVQTEPHNRRLAWWTRLICNTWFFEAIAATFSIFSFVAVIVVLRIYDNKATHPMPYGITLNALVSTLATASKASLLCAVAGSIGQLKWCWFRKQRNLYDLQAFDDASRGPAGSISLLFGRPKGVLASLGALIVVLALIFDPFIQQVLRYPTRSVQIDSLAATGKASSFSTSPDSTDFISAINSGFWSDASQYERTPSCITGHCEWPRFQSLGWCSKCADVTSKGKLSGSCSGAPGEWNGSCILSFGDGYDQKIATGYIFSGSGGPINGVDTTPEAVWTTYDMKLNLASFSDNTNPPRPRNVSLLGISGPAVVVMHASLSYGTPQTLSEASLVKAEQCVLTPCIRDYLVTMANGELQTEVLSINYGVTEYHDLVYYNDTYINGSGSDTWSGNALCWQPDKQNVTYQVTGCDENSSCLTANPPLWTNETRYSFCPVDWYAQKIASHFSETSTYQYSTSWDSGMSENGVTKDPSDLLRGITERGLPYVVGNVAASLTTLGLTLSNHTVPATVWSTETYVFVRWEWLILPLILEVAGVLLFLATIVVTRMRRDVLWRASLLPLLYYDLDREPKSEQTVGVDVSSMEHITRRTRATLRLPEDMMRGLEAAK